MLRGFLQIGVFYLSLFIFLLIGFVVYNLNNTQDHAKVLSSCTMHLPGHIHSHIMLRILFLHQPYLIPANTGIENSCMHPIHTHDTSGMLHIDYYKQYPFTLGDFFTDWGIIYSPLQLGSILTGSRYKITQLVNGKLNTDFEHYILHDRDKIEIQITNQ